jgi:hypothetical protein
MISTNLSLSSYIDVYANWLVVSSDVPIRDAVSTPQPVVGREQRAGGASFLAKRACQQTKKETRRLLDWRYHTHAWLLSLSLSLLF